METTNTSVVMRTVTPEEEGGRIDNYLIRVLKGVPKSLIYRVIRKGEVRVNKKRTKPEYKLVAGDIIRIPPIRTSDAPVVSPSTNLKIVANLADSILFENEGFLVLNKPAFMSVHGGSGVDYGVIEALRALRPESHYLELAHRIDRETSGCLIIAKKRSALRKLHEQFREKELHKQYLALVNGAFPKRLQMVNAPLHKNVLSSGERFVRIDEVNGKPSITDFKIREQYANATLVEASPRTGRTHQIRVHLAFKNFPILGDDKYGIKENNKLFKDVYNLDRMFLHAEKITFTDPISDKEMTVVAPLSKELQLVINKLKSESQKQD